MKQAFLSALILVLVVAFSYVATASQPLNLGNLNPIRGGSFEDVAKGIIDFLLVVAAPIAGIMVLVGGFQMITAGGDPAKYGTGKKTVLYAAIGYAVVLIADGVVYIIKELLGVRT